MNQKGFAPILIVIITAALAGGYLIYQNQNQTKPTPSPATQLTSTPTPIPESTHSAETTSPDLIGANWKTYTNNVSAFILKYPPEWVISETQDQVTIQNSKQMKHPRIVSPSNTIPQSKIVIEINKTSNNIGVQELRGFTQSTDTLEITQKTETKFQGKPAIKYQAKGIGLEEDVSGINVGLNNGFLRILLKNYAGNSENQQVLDQILSTFRFLP